MNKQEECPKCGEQFIPIKHYRPFHHGAVPLHLYMDQLAHPKAMAYQLLEEGQVITVCEECYTKSELPKLPTYMIAVHGNDYDEMVQANHKIKHLDQTLSMLRGLADYDWLTDNLYPEHKW